QVRWRLALATFLTGSFAVWFSALADHGEGLGAVRGAWTLFRVIRNSRYTKAMAPGADAYVPEHFKFILLTFAVGLVALTLLWFLRSQSLRRVAQFSML